MHKAILLTLITCFVVGSIAPDDKVTAPVLKIARQGMKLKDPPVDPKEGEAPAKLTLAQIRTAIASQVNRPIAGVTDLLRLDSRNMYVQGKGYMHVYGPAWVWPEYNSIRFHNKGSVHLNFTARPEQTQYLVDFQVNVRSGDAIVHSYTADMNSETTLHEGKNHILMLVSANGGRPRVALFVAEGECTIKGVEVSVLN